jgi:hypothetical protein
MAHWAEIDENNIVVRVVIGNNEDVDEGYQWLIDNLGGNWIKTSYNSRGGVHYAQEINDEGFFVASGKPHLRYNYAAVGYTYDEQRDAFIAPKPENIDGIEFILNEDTCLWELPESGA